MSEEGKPKVVWIHSRAPFEAPEPPLEAGAPCPKVIAALEALLDRAHSGELRDLALCTWNEEANFFHRVMVISGEDKNAVSSMRLVAGLELLKDVVMGEMMVAGNYLEDVDMEVHDEDFS